MKNTSSSRRRGSTIRMIPAFAGMALLLLIPSVFAADRAQPVQVTAKVFKNKIKIGDEFRFIVQIDRPRKFSVIPPQEKIDLSPFESKGRDTSPRISGSNRVLESYGYNLTVFALGELKIPSVSVQYRDESGTLGEAHSEPVAMTIVSVGKKLTDKDDIRPIKGPASTGLLRFLDWVLGSLAFCLGVFLAVKLVRRWLKYRQELEFRKPPHARARLELERLKSKGLLEEKKIKEFYSALSDILRNYMERALHLEALERTTTEIVEDMKRAGFDALTIGKVQIVLEDSDLVKFAKHTPDRAIADRLENEILEIVDLTKPVPTKKKS